MGASGSGRWGLHRKAVTVERCRVLDLVATVRAAPSGGAGTLRWSHGGVEVASLWFELILADGCPRAIRLSYQWTSWLPGSAPQQLTYDIPLERTAISRGGFRWWGRCPVSRCGVACGRRVGKLCLPPGATRFGCRACHRLTYASRQRHDPRVTRLLKDPAALHALAANPAGLGVTTLGVLLGALGAQQKRLDRLLGRASG
jgi:hypothetical protein